MTQPSTIPAGATAVPRPPAPPKRRPRWLLPAVVGVCALVGGGVAGGIIGAAIGANAVDPTQSSQYKAQAAELTTRTQELEGARAASQELTGQLNDALVQVEAIDDREDDLKARETKVAAAEKKVKEDEADVSAREKAVGIAEKEKAARSVEGDGVYVVGDDIKAGTYASDGGSDCYWARERNLSGELGGIIANHIGSGRQVVTILASDKAFETSNCGTWTRK